jgi:hypothetical protein
VAGRLYGRLAVSLYPSCHCGRTQTHHFGTHIFFTDDEGGVFYKSVPVPGTPTDLTVSPDRKWLAVIYTANGQVYVAVFAIDGFGGLAPVATSSAVGAAAFNGVAISE